MAGLFVLDLGLETFDVQDSEGNVRGTICFNPSDPGLAGRWDAVQKRLAELAERPESLQGMEDIAQLDDPDERAMFLEDLGVEQSGLDRLIQCSYELLGLISFLTYGKDECRAWTIRKGTKAPQAAGKIHSDIERGFIRAETINFDEMMACGSVAAAKEKGLLRSEGKDYVVKDGDMIYFRFNV